VFPIPSLCEKTPSRSNQHIQEASELFAIAYSGGYAGRSCLPLQRKSGRNFQVATNILFVDDEAPIREMLSLYFRKKGFSVTTATCGREAKELADQGPFNLAILDMNLAGESGLDLLGFFKSNYPALPVVVFTGMAADQGLLEKALAGGASGFMSKTEPLDKLFAEVNRHLLKAPAM